MIRDIPIIVAWETEWAKGKKGPECRWLRLRRWLSLKTDRIAVGKPINSFLLAYDRAEVERADVGQKENGRRFECPEVGRETCQLARVKIRFSINEYR